MRALFRLLDGAIVLAVALGLYVAWVGIPNWLVRRWLTPAPAQAYALDVGRLRFGPLRGFVADDVRVFRRRQIGPALLEARRVDVDASLLDVAMGRPMVSGLMIQNGLLRPRMLGTGGGGTSPGVALRLVLKGMDIEGVGISALEGDLTSDGDAWRLDNFYAALQHRAHLLELRGSVARDGGGDLSGQGTADGDPAVLIPFFEAVRCGVASRIIRDFTFPEAPPRGDWSFHIPGNLPRHSAVRFQLAMEDPVYRGVEASRADLQVQLTWADSNFTAEIRPMTVVRDEGVARGGLTIRHAPKTLALDFDVVSGLDPVAAAQMVGVWTNVVRTRFRFAPPYRMLGNGTVDLRHPGNVTLDADLGFGLLGVGRHDFSDCAFHFRMRGASRTLEEARAVWFGGVVQGRMEWRPAPGPESNTQFRTELEVADADFEQIAETLMDGAQQVYSGKLAGKLVLGGVAGKAHRDSLRGSGDLTIRGGHIFRLPMFGGLSDYLAQTIPGLGTLIGQSDLRTEFTIDQGRMRTDRLRVEGDVLSLLGKGSIGFDDTVDMDFQLTLLKSHTLIAKLVRVPTWLFSKLFEFRLTGTRHDPRWYPINFSKDLWQRGKVEGKKNAGESTDEDFLMEWDETW